MEKSYTGKVKRTTYNFVWETGIDMYRLEKVTKKYILEGYLNTEEIEEYWEFISNGKKFSDLKIMNKSEIEKSDKNMKAYYKNK